MSLFENPGYLKNLQSLLNPEENSSDSSDDEVTAARNARKMGPADIVTKKAGIKTEKSVEEKPKKDDALCLDEDKDDIDKWMEKQQKDDSDILDNRKRPVYTITYKQAVGTEDLFLRMNNKTTASMSCEDVVIEIQMPEETVGVNDMDLSVTESEIDLKSPLYRLKLPLTQPIDPDKGSARFDTDKQCLILTLRMKREYDFVNF